MSDEINSKQPTAAGVTENLCEHPGCGKWGGVGYTTGRAATTQWWCARHYPYWPAEIRAKYAALPV